MSPAAPIQASLFVTCIIDQLYPQVGVSVVRVLRRLGVSLDFPETQTCCGQPLYNSGFTRPARRLAARFLRAFAPCQYIIVPSGSCAAMLRVFYADLFADDPELSAQAQQLAGRVYEFSEFLVKILGVTDLGAAYPATAAYHSGCHLLRELEVKDEPVRLLENVSDLNLVPLPQADTCCGFGGTFAVKYPHISQAMLADKLAAVHETGADTLISCDLGCLLHLGGGLSRQGSPIAVRHIAQVLEGAAPGG